MARISYRGGWSTSICDLFNDPLRRSNCCALTCCGLLLSDRNAHLILDHQRPSWGKRFFWNLGMPIMILLALNILARFFATSETLPIWIWSIRLAMIIVATILLIRASTERMQVRLALLMRMNERHDTNREEDRDETDIFDTSSNSSSMKTPVRDIGTAHAICSCFRNDVIFESREQEEGCDIQNRRETPSDICSCIWNCLRSFCCCGICGYWLQCCGMCAIGQEDREIERILDPKLLQIDYITFQPYSDYYPEFLALVEARNGNIFKHWKVISLLSYNLMKILIVFLTVLTVVALLQIIPNFSIENLYIVIATFAQAFVVLWACHWEWHRFDLSTDAVIKYFAAGFCLTTFLAVILEFVIGNIVSTISYLIVILKVGEESIYDIEQVKSEFYANHITLGSIFVFLNAFVVAAVIEEFSKYFGYWMVETPDLMDPRELILNTETRRTNASSLESRGAGITIAMIAVATGFACSENLLYVFLYSDPSVGTQLTTLLARSLFPVHPLCAAIQSIGVIKRDLEGNRKWQIGLSILPAILLHGSYDFALMLMTFFQNVSGEQEGNETGNTDNNNEEEALISLSISVGMVFVGIIYYWVSSSYQKGRLAAMDQTRKTIHENLV